MSVTGSARTPLFAPPRVDVRRLDDGALVLSSPQALQPFPRCLGDLLEHWADTRPDRTFLTELDDAGAPRAISYGEARRAARVLAGALLDLGLSPSRPLLLLSDNDIDHALFQLAAMHAGVPAVPLSAAYSLLSKDLAKLRHIVALVQPGAVFAADGVAFGRALTATAAACAPAPRLITSRNPPAGALLASELLTGEEGGAAESAFRAVTPDSVAKILFTSGSTGAPKGVINTQRMLCSNQQAIVQLWPFLAERPPVVVDWLPWSHTFGGNHNFNMVLRHGGTLHIDAGKPTPGLIQRTVARLREASPTLYFNVPRGFDMLLPFLEGDDALRERFFRDLDLLFYASAALPQSLWARLEEVSRRARGAAVPMVSAWGATETAPMVTSVHYPLSHAGNIGLPTPGCELKLSPVGGRQELRVRGPNVTPGYHRGPGAPPGRDEAFDEEGFYRTGDAGRLADPADPVRGVEFDGRLSENFKLSSGTWVSVGELRIALVAAAAPAVQDAVIAGHDRDEIGALLFLSPAGCARLCGGETPPPAELARHPAVRRHLRETIAAHNRQGQGTSRRVARVLVLEEPPSIDAGEITDKGYINQRAVLARRADLVERLFRARPDEAVIGIDTPATADVK
jgi:feruloyl-CoA synthase